MGFMRTMGRALSAPLRAPGMGAITKPVGKVMGSVPGVNKVAGSIPGMSPSGPPKPTAGIGPSPQVMGPPPPDQGVPIQQGPPPQMMGPQGPPPGPPGPEGDMGGMMGGMAPGSFGQGAPQQMDPRMMQAIQNMKMQQSGGPQMPQRGLTRGMGPSPQMMGQMRGLTR